MLPDIDKSNDILREETLNDQAVLRILKKSYVFQVIYTDIYKEREG